MGESFEDRWLATLETNIWSPTREVCSGKRAPERNKRSSRKGKARAARTMLTLYGRAFEAPPGRIRFFAGVFLQALPFSCLCHPAGRPCVHASIQKQVLLSLDIDDIIKIQELTLGNLLQRHDRLNTCGVVPDLSRFSLLVSLESSCHSLDRRIQSLPPCFCDPIRAHRDPGNFHNAHQFQKR